VPCDDPRVNVPNVLTVVRTLLVPVFVVALLQKTHPGDLIAAVTFGIASATDFVDGYLARRNNIVTTFGKIADPIADKLLIIAALVVLVSLHHLAVWVAVVIIARELAVTGLRAAAGSRGVVISASQFGKLKTVFQIAAVLSLILDHGQTWVNVVAYITVAITLGSGFDYFRWAATGMAGGEPAASPSSS
jgi:CDP-diacylglycerol---glycerol-3-phosphate 3-phosphatidyltransferase